MEHFWRTEFTGFLYYDVREDGFFGLYVWQRIMKSTEIEREKWEEKEKREERERENISLYFCSAFTKHPPPWGWMQIHNGKRGKRELQGSGV